MRWKQHLHLVREHREVGDVAAAGLCQLDVEHDAIAALPQELVHQRDVLGGGGEAGPHEAATRLEEKNLRADIAELAEGSLAKRGPRRILLKQPAPEPKLAMNDPSIHYSLNQITPIPIP